RRSIRQRDHDAIRLGDGLSAVRDQLQHFVQDEAFRFKQVAIGRASGGGVPVPYLLVQVREGKQGAQSFLVRNRFEDAVALLQWKTGVGRGRRFPVNSGWIGTHAGTVRTTKNLRSSFLWSHLYIISLARRKVHCRSRFDRFNRPSFTRSMHKPQLSPGNDAHNSNIEPNSLW